MTRPTRLPSFQQQTVAALSSTFDPVWRAAIAFTVAVALRDFGQVGHAHCGSVGCQQRIRLLRIGPQHPERFLHSEALLHDVLSRGHHHQVAVDDLGSAKPFSRQSTKTIKYFNDGDIVRSTVVKVDVTSSSRYRLQNRRGHPGQELSIKHDVDRSRSSASAMRSRHLSNRRGQGEGRLILSKKRNTSAWGTIEKIKEEDGVVTSRGIEELSRAA